MAARFVVALAIVALCQSTPVVINGVYYRDGRGYAVGQATNYGGASSATANVNGGAATAFGTATGNQLARDGYYSPDAATAQAQAFENPGFAKATAQAQNGGYYTVPAPAAVITYEQSFENPAGIYEIPVSGALNAQSSAVQNGGSDTSISSATTNGAGVAESSAQTQRGVGSYGVTSSNAKTYGSGFGSANSNAKSGYGSTATSAQTQGLGSASSAAQTNEQAGTIYPVDNTVIDLKAHRYEAAYVPVAPAFASSNANVNQFGNAASSAKASNGQTGISWRFGTAYSVPQPASHALANTYSGFNTAKSEANTNGYGSANANANANNGIGYVKSTTYNNGFGSAKSSANANGAGLAKANADVNSGYGSANSVASTQYGTALTSANTNSGFGAAKSTAHTNGAYYGGSETVADAESNGYGAAKSLAKTQGVSTAFRVSESSANTFGHGSAHAKAHTA